MFVVNSKYNEPEDILEGTLLKVGRCIRYMQKVDSTCNGEQLSPSAWLQKITVLLVIDGRDKLDKGNAVANEFYPRIKQL